MELKAEQITRAIKILEGARVIVANRDFDNFQDAIITAKNALNQVKELTEENERLHASCTELAQECKKWQSCLEIECKYTKADTVRKMQERLKQAVKDIPWCEYPPVHNCIDQIAKEMVEGENNENH